MTSIAKFLPLSVRDKYRERWTHRWKHRVGGLQRLFVRPKFPKNPAGKVFVHLGCGIVDHPKFINVDAIRLKHIHHVHTVERLPMFAAASVDLIYSAHCLEHISHLEVSKALAEWFRVLKPGGTIRLSVPDFDQITAMYLENDRSIAAVELQAMGGQDYEQNFHKAMFNEAHLKKLLEQAGFVHVRKWQPGSDELTTFNDWSGRTIKLNGKEYLISLNLEAEKSR